MMINRDNETTGKEVYITPSDVMEYCFCPRFIYFMNVLSIPQHEEKRHKVMLGRDIHEQKSKINKEYVRKRIGCVDKQSLVYLTSTRYKLKGEVDEVLTLADGTMAPLDYKFAEYHDFVFKTHKIQSALYALLIKENFGCEVNKGYICYIRSNHKLVEIEFRENVLLEAARFVEEIFCIIQKGYFPKRAPHLTRCVDCCYRNICVK